MSSVLKMKKETQIKMKNPLSQILKSVAPDPNIGVEASRASAIKHRQLALF
jgi:hypothetical protein